MFSTVKERLCQGIIAGRGLQNKARSSLGWEKRLKIVPRFGNVRQCVRCRAEVRAAEACSEALEYFIFPFGSAIEFCFIVKNSRTIRNAPRAVCE